MKHMSWKKEKCLKSKLRKIVSIVKLLTVIRKHQTTNSAQTTCSVHETRTFRNKSTDIYRPRHKTTVNYSSCQYKNMLITVSKKNHTAMIILFQKSTIHRFDEIHDKHFKACMIRCMKADFKQAMCWTTAWRGLLRFRACAVGYNWKWADWASEV